MKKCVVLQDVFGGLRSGVVCEDSSEDLNGTFGRVWYGVWTVYG